MLKTDAFSFNEGGKRQKKLNIFKMIKSTNVIECPEAAE